MARLWGWMGLSSTLKCPACGAKDVIRIVYGLPTEKAMKRAHRGEIMLGGCVVTDSDPNRLCRACGRSWVDETDFFWIERRRLRQSRREGRNAGVA